MYLNRNACHPSSTFNGIVSTLSKQARNICSSTTLDHELDDLHDILLHNGFTKKEASRVYINRHEHQLVRHRPKPDSILPYIPRLYESIKRIFNRVNLTTGYRPVKTLRQNLMKKRPKPSKKLGVVYRIDCANCDWNYVGESSRTIEERTSEHKRAVKNFNSLSEISNYSLDFDHQMNWEPKIIDREQYTSSRLIKEAIWSKHFKSGNRVKFPLSDPWYDII